MLNCISWDDLLVRHCLETFCPRKEKHLDQLILKNGRCIWHYSLQVYRIISEGARGTHRKRKNWGRKKSLHCVPCAPTSCIVLDSPNHHAVWCWINHGVPNLWYYAQGEGFVISLQMCCWGFEGNNAALSRHILFCWGVLLVDDNWLI